MKSGAPLLGLAKSIYYFRLQCHALISDGSLALCTALEQCNLLYLKNRLQEGNDISSQKYFPCK